jgi:tetratricopeptide (TPR) repeat protein
MMKKLLLFVAFSATAIGVQAKEPVDNLGVQAISAADFSTAEARLNAQLRRDPTMPEALLNLAHVYRATGRPDDAVRMYNRVLISPEIEMTFIDAATGNEQSISSHTLAKRGLAIPQSFAAR